MSARSAGDTRPGRPSLWTTATNRTRVFAHHPDPLAEAANWVALIIGSHLPFWPLYVLWSAGRQSMPTSLLTVALSPVFLLIPLLSRRGSLLGRIAMLLSGIANTVLTVWILGMNSGSALFLAPCAALAILLFRRAERVWMLVFTLLPLVVWYILRDDPPPALHRYDASAAGALVFLNTISIGVLASVFGLIQADIYKRMEDR